VERAVQIAVGGLRLEARLESPPSPSAGVVLCHPHPLYGGDMDNPVVVRAAEACREVGCATLRLNFRGVGGSSGTHDEGRGERDDVLGAVGLLETEVGGAPLGIVGYSFGAWVAAAVAEDPRLAGLALIAPPLAMYRLGPLPRPRPLRLVAGSRDPYCPRADLERLARRLAGARLSIIEGADHFFFGKLYPLGEAVAAWARELSKAEARQAGGRGAPG
jgi:alpha/beta superfamily hydrolase